MIRKSGNRFSTRQTRSVCAQIMLKQRNEIVMRFYLIASRSISRANRRRLDRHVFRARHQIKLEFDKFRRAVVESLGAHADHAIAQAALQRSERLPLEAIERIAGWVGLRDRRSGQMFVPIVVMAIRATEIELALSSHE